MSKKDSFAIAVPGTMATGRNRKATLLFRTGAVVGGAVIALSITAAGHPDAAPTAAAHVVAGGPRSGIITPDCLSCVLPIWWVL